MRAIRFPFPSFVIALCFTPLADAQITDVTNSTFTPAPGVGHDYNQAAGRLGVCYQRQPSLSTSCLLEGFAE